MGGNISPAITAHYHKAGGSDFTPHERNHIPHLAILEIMEEPKKHVVEPLSCAMRGRNVDNPSDRTAGIPTEQRLEIGSEIANCLTSVQKDSMVVEPCILGYTRDKKGKIVNFHEKEFANTINTYTGSGGSMEQYVKESVTRQNNIAYKRMPNGNIRAFDASTPDKRGISELQIVNPDNECPTITTAHEPKVLLRYRIRKLTERECFRLMDVSDSEIDKIEAHRIKVTLKNGTVKEKPIPKSAKYKLAGNSIVVSCLYHIFHQMFIAEPPEPKPIQKLLFDF